MKRKRRCSSAAAMVLVAAILVVPAGAAVRTWDDGDAGNSYWSDPDNWDPNGYAESDDLIVLSGVPTANADVVTDDDGSITLDGPTSVADFGTYDVVVAYGGKARMDILNGADLSNRHCDIGSISSGRGDVTVSGAGSTWANNDYLYVGRNGTGTLTIDDGGNVSNSDGLVGNNVISQGDVTVSGTGSTWTNSIDLYIGVYGTGTLTVNDGGTVSNSDGHVGDAAGSQGYVTVSGAGSTWANRYDLDVGRDGTGTLTINNGGNVSNSDGYVGNAAGSQGDVAVSGAGSTWTNSGNLFVGGYGTGTLTVNDGGTVSNRQGYVGYIGSQGEVTVSGTGSTWANDEELSVGHHGTGTLRVVGGGMVSNAKNGLIGWADDGVGAVTVSGAGSTWSCGSNGLYLGGGDHDGNLGGAGSGTLTISDGGSVSNSNGYVGYHAGASGDVTVSGAGSTWTNSSHLYVGREGTGTLTINHGGIVSNSYGYVGRYADSLGHVTVSGAGSTWANSSNLFVGHAGTGTLTINDGGTVSNSSYSYVGYSSGAEGAVTVSGAGSRWTSDDSLYVGHSGTGTLTIEDGGIVTVHGSLSLGHLSGSSGTVNLDGGSLTATFLNDGSGSAAFNWTGGALAITGPGGLTLYSSGLLGPTVGVNHNKGLSVSAATTINSGVKLAVTGGTFSTETLTVSGTAQLCGGTITIGDTFAVNSTGELEITGQDLVLLGTPTLAGNLVLDQTTLSVPSMTVASGASLDLDSGRLSASGTFANQDVVRMGNTGPATIRAGALSNTGALMGEGTIQAVVTNTGNIALSGDSSFTENVTNEKGGKIIISGGSAVTFFDDVDNQLGEEIRVSQNCTATYFGELSGGNFTGTGTSYIEGDMRPGASPGIMAFEGDVVFGSAAGLKIELDGPENDLLTVAGNVSLDGTLTVQAIDDLGTVGESTRTIIETTEADSIIGDFAAKPAAGDYLDYGVFFRGADKADNAYNLSLFQAGPGDFDGDGDVDLDDLSLLDDGWDPTATDKIWTDGDGDQDGDVDLDDLSLLDDHWAPAGYLVLNFGGEANAPLGGPAAVPEPGTLMLLCTCLGGLLAYAWRKRRRR